MSAEDKIYEEVTKDLQTTSEIAVKAGYTAKTAIVSLRLLAAAGKVEEVRQGWRGRYKYRSKWRRL
jgi:GTP-sensing pleiotropic transcriptional regulator CodY